MRPCGLDVSRLVVQAGGSRGKECFRDIERGMDVSAGSVENCDSVRITRSRISRFSQPLHGSSQARMVVWCDTRSWRWLNSLLRVGSCET